jgi:mono/diheme cytochrome c family protein
MKHFNNTLRNSALLAACLLASGGLAATAQATDFPEPGNFSTGSKVWADNCGRCHNMRGPKELRDDQWISTAFHMRMRAGLTGQETRDLITFLQGSNTKAVKASSTSIAAVPSTTQMSGKDIFNGTCSACHGSDGKGAFPGTPDFTSSSGPLSKSDDVLIDHITNGFQSPGSPMAMPPKGGNPNMDVTGIKAVLAYLRETFGKQ